MADRVLNREATVYTTRFTSATGAAVTVINPRGEVVANNETPVEYSNGLSYTIPIVDVPGIWRVEWYVAPTLVRDTFSVGAEDAAEMTLFDLRAATARRVINESHIGFVTQADGEILIDETAIGGHGSYKGWWITIDEPGPAKPHRVLQFTGSGFTCAPRFDDVEPGTRYLLTPISPHETNLAVKSTMTELSSFARIPIRINGLEPVEGTESGTFEVDIPYGISRVHNVIIDDEIALPGSGWVMRPGRKIFFSTDTELVSIEGIRDGTVPKWEDSYLDFDAGAVQARVAALLHASRAASQSMDEDENLRRQMAAMDEYMELRRRSTGRPQTGQRVVLD